MNENVVSIDFNQRPCIVIWEVMPLPSFKPRGARPIISCSFVGASVISTAPLRRAAACCCHQDYGSATLPPLHLVVFISHTGEVFPSGFLPFAAGNVRSESLTRIYRESPVFQQLRDADQLGGKCGACEFRHICGGSRARAFALTADPMAEEPCCAYVPKNYVPPANVPSLQWRRPTTLSVL